MAFNLKKNIAITMLGKSLLLVSNFLVVVLTARLWGAEGRGYIAMVVADVGLLGIITSMFTGSNVSYYLQRVDEGRLFTMGIAWTTFVSLLGSVAFYFFEVRGVVATNTVFFFFIISFALGLLSFLNSMFVGMQRIGTYNLVMVVQPLLLLTTMLLFHTLLETGYRTYFYAWSCSLTLMVVFLLWREQHTFQLIRKSKMFSKKDFVQSFLFGFKTQLSECLQFFNARLSYYFLAFYVGDASVGVFSIGVALSEAVLVLARSISMVQYSRLLKEKGGKKQARQETTMLAKVSLAITFGALVVANLLPVKLFTFVFGEEFGEVKTILLYLSPGILVASVADVIGHYFSAMGKLKILVTKSLVGVIFAFVVSSLLISKLKINGAIVVNLTSNLVTSLVLFYSYMKEGDKIKQNKQ